MNRFPVPPPDDPLPIVTQWLAEASAAGARRNPTAMALATVSPDGVPSVRIVLLKSVSVEHGYGVFYTNYASRKARELDTSGRAAAALYWEDLGRQIRFEGPVVRAPAAESDAYFQSRPWRSQLNAWTSVQSATIEGPDELASRARTRARELGLPDPEGDATAAAVNVPRPPFWGGYRLWFAAVELWLEGHDRFHERLRYERSLDATPAQGYEAGAWAHVWLQP